MEMTITETTRLTTLESTIERGLQTFVEVGNALLEIRDGKLYRANCGTFEDYCRERWGMVSRHANRLIEAAQVVENLRPIGLNLPANEAQARALAPFAVQFQREVWPIVVDTAPNGAITANHIQHTVDFYERSLDAALADEAKPVCLECGQVYDGAGCPDCNPRMSQAMQVMLSHESVEWYTPIEIIEAARQVMGSIDLDPASCDDAQQNVKASRYYTAEMNGLSRVWSGRVWLNPPYSKTAGRSNQDIWAKKLLQEFRDGNVTEGILLVKSALGYRWFEDLWDELPVCFARQRLSFIKSNGDDDGESKHGTALFYLGENIGRFVEVFSKIGRITTITGEYINQW